VQEFIPRAKAFASGSILGMIFGTGALGSLILGALAQAISLPSAFVVVAVTVAISGLLSFALPKRVTR
jgi:MFS transporter, FSR family, fosmidomycin resistance protein